MRPILGPGVPGVLKRKVMDPFDETDDLRTSPAVGVLGVRMSQIDAARDEQKYRHGNEQHFESRRVAHLMRRIGLNP
jgi:hypothetical protein